MTKVVVCCVSAVAIIGLITLINSANARRHEAIAREQEAVTQRIAENRAWHDRQEQASNSRIDKLLKYWLR